MTAIHSLIELCNYLYNPISEHFITPKSSLEPVSNQSPLLPLDP